MGTPRSQSYKANIRVIYLCHECFVSLPVCDLNDLFRLFASPPKTKFSQCQRPGCTTRRKLPLRRDRRRVELSGRLWLGGSDEAVTIQ